MINPDHKSNPYLGHGGGGFGHVQLAALHEVMRLPLHAGSMPLKHV